MDAAPLGELPQSLAIRTEIAAQQPRLCQQPLNPLAPYLGAGSQAIQDRALPWRHRCRRRCYR
jgi:hypothetical protein